MRQDEIVLCSESNQTKIPLEEALKLRRNFERDQANLNYEPQKYCSFG